jgi:hypothetical protein
MKATLNRLTKIDLSLATGDQIQKLWDAFRTQDYVFDDTTRDRSEVFLAQLFAPFSEHFILGDHVGYLSAYAITRFVNAYIHVTIWGKITSHEIIESGNELLSYLFTEYDLNRVTAMIPVINKSGLRLATLFKFKYEGDLRKMFLSYGEYHNVSMYGLLRSEFTGVKHA